MEALRLLKHCRLRRAAPIGEPIADARATKTIVASAVSPHFSDGEDESYFDLEFPLTSDDNANEEEEEDEISFSAEEISDDDENEEELNFTLLSNECTGDENVKLSPSDELILSRNSVHLESSSILLEKELEDNSKSPVSSLKSPSKFGFLLLKLKKPKSGNGILEKAENMVKNEDNVETQENQGKSGNNFFTVKFKVEEVKLPLVSLFKRDHCSKEKKGKVDDMEDSDSNAGSDERKITKEMVQKYLKMVKPLNFQLTKNYMGRLKLSGHLSFPKGGGADSPPCSAADVVGKVGAEKANQKQGNSSINNLQAGLKIVRKHLGKSRSGSATVEVAPPGKVVADRRDDSMLQVHDGIQGAIMHCKKSLSSAKSSGN